MAKKTAKNADGSERCDRTHCYHTHLMHGNGSKAHNFSTECVVVGCGCNVFLPAPATPSEPRVRIPRTLDRSDPKLFETEPTSD